MLLFTIALIASPLVFAAGANDFKLNADNYFEALTAELKRELGDIENIPYLKHNYWLRIEDDASEYTLHIYNGTINKFDKILQSEVTNENYSIPAIGANYTLNIQLQWKFRLVSNTSALRTAEGRLIMEVSGLNISVAIAANQTSDGSYTSYVIKDEMTRAGKLYDVLMNNCAAVKMQHYAEVLYQRHSHEFSAAVQEQFSTYFNNSVSKVDISKYVESSSISLNL